MDNLKPCPFCGAKAELRNSKWANRDHYGVICTDCAVWFDERADHGAEAIAAWNTRAPDPRLTEVEAERDGLLEALSPDGDTKAAYMGEFSFNITEYGDDGGEIARKIYVPWTTIKEIMAAIKARAALGAKP